MSISTWTRAALVVAAMMVLMAPVHAAEQAVRTSSSAVSQPCSVQDAALATETRELLAARGKSGSPGFASKLGERRSHQTLIARINAERDPKSNASPGSTAKKMAACTVVHCCGRRVSCCGKQDCRRKCPCWP